MNKPDTNELRFRLRFDGPKVGMHEQILCEAVARILERKPSLKQKKATTKAEGR